MIVQLETKRLFLRPLQLADAEETERLFPQWEIVKFLDAQVPWPWTKGLVFRHYRDVILPAIESGDAPHNSCKNGHGRSRLSHLAEQFISPRGHAVLAAANELAYRLHREACQFT